jgi:hypothetical protein
MAEQVYDRRLGLQHGQGALSQCHRFDDGPLHHAIAKPPSLRPWIWPHGRL